MTTQHNLNTSWVGHENDCSKPTTPHHINSPAASMSLRTTFIDHNKYSVISNNNKGHNNKHNNNNNKNENNINKKIISFRSLRLTFIDHN